MRTEGPEGLGWEESVEGRPGVRASRTIHGFACWLSSKGSNLRREMEVLFLWRPLLGVRRQV